MPNSGGLGRGFEGDGASLVVYLMAGYPDRATSLEALKAAARVGADVIELGVPYSDALADGPVIVRAANEAMRAADGRFGLAEALDLAAEYTSWATKDLGEKAPPIALMTYYNPMLKRGLAKTAAEALAAGVGGFIIPDLPPDAAGPWLEVSDGLDTVFLAAPTSTADRLALVAEASSGFVYCVSTTGVTGERAELPEDLPETVKRVRASSALPVAVGFGVSTPAQCSRIAKIADGVVVGSACVRRQVDPTDLGAFVGELAKAVHDSHTA